MKRKLIKFSLILSFICFLSVNQSCDKEDRIPYVYVNFQIYPDLPQFMSLKTPGNHLKVTGGVKGIILYCQFLDEYNAYERNCPYDPYAANAVLDVDSTGLFLECNSCGSIFSLYDGTQVNTESKYPVLQYSTHLEAGKLYVYNSY